MDRDRYGILENNILLELLEFKRAIACLVFLRNVAILRLSMYHGISFLFTLQDKTSLINRQPTHISFYFR